VNLVTYWLSRTLNIAESVSVPEHIARSIYIRRRVFILLLLAVTLFAQTAALTSEHQHHHVTEHCCLLCHMGLPFLQGGAPATVAPLASLQWLTGTPHFEFFYEVFLPTSPSRGPPALS
jgi:hypothetical protein